MSRVQIQQEQNHLDSQYKEQKPFLDPEIARYQLRAGANYLSPSTVTTRPPGIFGVPYWMQGITLQTCDYFITTAPPNTNAILLPQPTQHIAKAPPTGSAPTTGVYSGRPHVQEHC